MARIEYPQALIDEARKHGVQLGSGEDYDPSDALQTLGAELQETARMNGDVSPRSIKWNDDPDDPFAWEDDEYADFGGFSFKKLGRGIGKIAKGVGKGVKKVASNKVFQVVMPMTAIGIHTTDKALGGKGVFKGKLGQIVDAGTSVALKVAPLGSAMGELGKQLPGVVGGAKGLVAPLAKQAQSTIKSSGVLSFGVQANGNIKGAMAQADKLLGNPRIGNAPLVIRNTKALAALGDPNAKRGLAVLNATAAIRVAKKVPPGKAAVPKVPVKTPVVQKSSPAKVVALAKTTAAKKQADKSKETWVVKVLGWFGLAPKKAA